ncbi:hypothetical protein [Butyrivibrio sp. LC3010]|uniref:hypothetical protein n=1 Tax=Butyrivibrio sp. LC3010 TaxID=1280680 RepID=UPI00040900C6|nr:hypothetical protein [Butyrivibrio sp. LC3010]
MMDYKLIESVFCDAQEKIKDSDMKLCTIVKMYEHELLKEYGAVIFDENYFRKLVENTSPVIEKQYEEQNEDGSIDGDIYKTSIFIAMMCVTSRVYDDLDAIFARDCMHAGLDAAHYLLVNKPDLNQLDTNEKLAMLWAFSELSKTDKEIKNAYDHSMMAGMPQKMSRQKRYKVIVNDLIHKARELSSDNGTAYDVYGSGLEILVFSCMTILVDEGDAFFDEAKDVAEKLIFELADEALEKSYDELIYSQKILLLIASIIANYILDKDKALSDGEDSQLIKVIEYKIINKKKNQLSDDEKEVFNKRIIKYIKKIDNQHITE